MSANSNKKEVPSNETASGALHGILFSGAPMIPSQTAERVLRSLLLTIDFNLTSKPSKISF